MRLSRHDDKVEAIEDTRVYQVLEEFVGEYCGNGLTANALCYLTEQPWETVRNVLTRYDGHVQIGAMYCYEVHAPVFYVHKYCRPELGNLLTRTPAGAKNLKKADAIIKKFPPPKWQGATNDKGEKRLTFYQFVRDTEEDEDWCGDPECCPEPKFKKATSKAELASLNRTLARELKRVWKE